MNLGDLVAVECREGLVVVLGARGMAGDGLGGERW